MSRVLGGSWSFDWPHINQIFWIIGAALLNIPGDWIDRVIAFNVTSIFTFLGILLGVKLKDSRRKWRILLFSFCCLFVAAAIAFFVRALICDCLHKRTYTFLSLICWGCGTLIVISLTTYYFVTYGESEGYSLFYMILVSSFEFMILLMISQLHVNYYFYCFNKVSKTYCYQFQLSTSLCSS
ncbi:unnamed protein product [Schistosoma turkestanicum]|nr:unnamed protein product [Schistosoma turkestanicum]